MAATNIQEVSFAASSSLPPQNYDIFLSFRGEDTRKKFTDHLFAALVHHGFTTFRDNILKRGEEVGFGLLKAIEESRISIIVFSRNYADSRWCLDELVKIMECKGTFQQIVVPVFYDVDPSDVRAQKGSFGEAFGRHEKHYEEGKVQRWRAALTDAANLSGWHLQDVADGHESKFIETIIDDILNKLNPHYFDIAIYPVGIESRVQHINSMLSLGANDVRIVGIWGIGGIGKTTIAKAIYNQIHLQFEGSSFLANVREISKQSNGLVGLQEQLLSNFLKNEIGENINIRNVDQGIEAIKKKLRHRRILVVLDDVDEVEQLNKLAIRRDWFHLGSRIIITTRDESLLNYLEVCQDGKYMPKLLTYEESLDLFHWHAFGRDHPIEAYLELSKEAVGYARGIPLVLEVWGSFFKGTTSMDEWKSALERLKLIPHKTIQEKLKISYDSLDTEEKKLFLDIACFFVGMDKAYTIKILKGCGFFPEMGLGVLFRRCLVRIDGDRLMMHDMIRDMGREISRKECPEEPGKRCRLWFHDDILDVLTNHKGTDVIEGLVCSHSLNDVRVNARAFENMNRLRLLKLNRVHPVGSYEHLSKRLIWFCWHGFPLKFMPSNLFLEKVVAIDMRYSCLKLVWKERKILKDLKFLNLGHSHYLTETPDFSGLTNLEMLLLNDCPRLVKVHHSIEHLRELIVLDMKNCKKLRKLPLGIWKLISLRKLSLHGCSNLEMLPGYGPQSSPFLTRIPLVRNPISLLPACTWELISIRNLDLSNCNLSDIPIQFGGLLSLEMLNLEGNNFRTLPASIVGLHELLFLNLSECPMLEFLPMLPLSLIAVVARNCPLLERISIGSKYFIDADQSTSFQRKSNESFVLVPEVSSFFGCRNIVNSLESNFESHLDNQGLATLGSFNISLPNVDVSLECKSVGSDLSFVVSDQQSIKIEGWAISVFYTIYRDEENLHHMLPFFYTVKNKTKGLKRRYKAAFDEYPVIHKDYVWIHHVPFSRSKLKMEAGDEVEFSVSVVNPLFQVKKCGVRIIAPGEDLMLRLQSHMRILYYRIPEPSYEELLIEFEKRQRQQSAIRTLGKRNCTRTISNHIFYNFFK